MNWSHEDPRNSIDKRARIVILRPGTSGYKSRTAGTGEVDTKETWAVFTSFEDHRVLGPDDPWDNSWMWIFGPNE